MNNKSIKKYEALPPEIIKQQDKLGIPFAIGDMFLTNSAGEVIRIKEFVQIEEWANPSDRDCKKKIKVWAVVKEHAKDWECTKWSGDGTETVEDFIEKLQSGKYSKTDKPIKQLIEEANKVIAGEIDISVYEQPETTDTMNEETALIGRNSKDSLLGIQKGLEEKKRTAELIHKAVAFEMEKRRRDLEQIKNRLYGVVAVFEKQVKKIMRVITTIELYLGIDEEIHQIQSGEAASVDTPISFRQLVLYADEEVGIHEDGGIDFKSIDQFDKWITTGNNIDIVLPDKKGIVVMNPRRNDKDYGFRGEGAGLKTSMMNIPNHENTYILIRNGDNLYRIFTEKLIIKDRLFPLRKEMSELFNKMQQETWDRKKEEIEDEMYQYKKQAMLLQGLVDRTDVFKPLPVERINIFKLEEHEELVNFIYDAEAALTQGKKSFQDWKREMNGKITTGSRVMLTGEYERYSHRKNYSDRFYLAKNSYDGLKNVPDLPQRGVYEVEYFISSETHHYRESEYKSKMSAFNKGGIKAKYEGVIEKKVWSRPDEKTGSNKIHVIRTWEKEGNLTILYMPDAEATQGWNSWDTHERKQRTRFKILPEDEFVFNYDQVELADVDYYLKSRIDREDYLEMMPVLKELTTHLKDEAKNEEFFIRLVVDRNVKKLTSLTREDVDARVREAIKWWKFKNKWKRPITKDDALALRMIEKRISI